MDWKTYIIRLAISIFVGGLIGVEREFEQKPAGLRTIILVCLGSTIFILIGTELTGFGLDQSRIIAGVITGIGFLGAGAIIRAKGEVYGLTTAATIWLVSGLGIAVGAGYYFLATLATLSVLVVLRILGFIERKLPKRK